MRAAQAAALHTENRRGAYIVTEPSGDEGGAGREHWRPTGSGKLRDQLVVALGPWSCLVEEWLGVPVPEGVWSTSILTTAPRRQHASRLRAARFFCAEMAEVVTSKCTRDQTVTSTLPAVLLAHRHARDAARR